MINFPQKGKNMNRKQSSKSSIILGYCVYKHRLIPLKKRAGKIKDFSIIISCKGGYDNFVTHTILAYTKLSHHLDVCFHLGRLQHTSSMIIFTLSKSTLVKLLRLHSLLH